MRALRVTQHGNPGDVLAICEVPEPEPGPGQVLIRVSAGSLNFNDIDRCRGRLVTVPTPPPFTLGMDACGVVESAGLDNRGVLQGAGGTLVIESVFTWPGMGRALVVAVRDRDYVMIQAITMLLVLIFLSVNLLVDLSYVALDPRIRLGRSADA